MSQILIGIHVCFQNGIYLKFKFNWQAYDVDTSLPNLRNWLMVKSWNLLPKYIWNFSIFLHLSLSTLVKAATVFLLDEDIGLPDCLLWSHISSSPYPLSTQCDRAMS